MEGSAMVHHEWGWMIVVYLFVGGLGAGCLALSGAAHLAGRDRYRGIARAGALLAPLLVGAGSGLLVFDLGRPLRFWRLFVTVNPVSPMSVGSWLLILFSIVATVYAVFHLPPEWLRAAARRAGRLGSTLETLAEWNRPAAFTTGSGDSRSAAEPFPGSPAGIVRLRSLLAMAGIPLGLGVGIYTGVLLGAIPARPFWNTPMVAQLFLFSALSTATALLLLVAPLVWKADPAHRELEQRALLGADLVFIFFELFIIIPYIVHAQLSVLSAKQALNMILGGPYTRVFWIGVVVVGILIPMLLETVHLLGGFRRLPRFFTRPLHFAVPVMILIGGYLLRWVFVHAGQDTWFL
jgi:formate-dependent nitrite reductase membrane component NrfD